MNNKYAALNDGAGFEPVNTVKPTRSQIAMNKNLAAKTALDESKAKLAALQAQMDALKNKTSIIAKAPAAKPAVKPVVKASVKAATKSEDVIKSNTSSVGTHCAVGSISAKEFLDCLSTFNYGAEWQLGMNPNTPNIIAAVEFLQTKLLPDVIKTAQQMRNHERVCALIDGYIGYNIGQPRGIQLMIARDLANATLNKDGGYTPCLSASELSQYIHSRTEWVVKQDPNESHVNDAAGRINASIGDDGDIYIKIKNGDVKGIVHELMTAITYSCELQKFGCMNKSQFASTDPDTFTNLATAICGFTDLQAALIIKAGFENFESPYNAQKIADLVSKVISIGPLPKKQFAEFENSSNNSVKKDRSGYVNAKIGDIFARNGLPLSTINL